MFMASADELVIFCFLVSTPGLQVDVALRHIIEGGWEHYYFVLMFLGEQFNCLPFDMKADELPSAVLMVPFFSRSGFET